MSSNKPLTPEEEAWVKANAEKVRELILAQAEDIGEKAKPSDPVESAAKDMIAYIRKQLSRIETEISRKNESLSLYVRMAASDDADTATYARDVIDRDKREVEEAMRKFKLHKDALNRKLEVLENHPIDAFLPIGTIVRFEGVPDYANSLSLSDDRKSYPIPGTIGVVTGLRHDSEHALAVGIRKEFKDGWNCTYMPDYDRFPVYKVDRSMLTVIGYGKLPDGTDYEGYGFHPTHIRKEDKIDPDRQEMVLECDGHFWRFHDFGGTQSIEALQAYEDIEEMTWIVGPREEYAADGGPKM